MHMCMQVHMCLHRHVYVYVWVCICVCLCCPGLPFLQTHICSHGMPALGLYLHPSQDPCHECPYPRDMVTDPCSRSEEQWMRDNTTQPEPAVGRASKMSVSSALAQKYWLRTTSRPAGVGIPVTNSYGLSAQGTPALGWIGENLGSWALPCLAKKEAAETKNANSQVFQVFEGS